MNNSNVAKYTGFAVESLVLGLIFWIIDDSLLIDAPIKDEEERYNKLRLAKNLASAIFAARSK